MNGSEVSTLEGVLDALLTATEGDSEVEVRDVVEAFSERLFAPLLVVLGAVVVTPIGGIPFVPTAIGVLLVLVASQRALGRRQPWLPRRVLAREVERSRLEASFERLRPWARRIDRFVKPRLRALTSGVMGAVNAVAVVALACTMPPLELVPFAAAAPGAAVLVFGLSMVGHDGAFALAGWVLAAGVGVLVSTALG